MGSRCAANPSYEVPWSYCPTCGRVETSLSLNLAMTQPLRLTLVLHNHQPIGNFDGVFEQAYQDSYLRFLNVFERYEGLKIGLHTSGSLMEWIDAKHPEYVDRLGGLVAAGRIEI